MKKLVKFFLKAFAILAYVARGVIDAYNIEDLSPWDIAAGALIIREAGGVVIGAYGGEYDIMKPNVIAACNYAIANEIKQLIRESDVRLRSQGKSADQLLNS